MRKEERNLVFLVEEQIDNAGGYGHVICRIVNLEEGKVRNISDGYNDVPTRYYAGLDVRNQLDDRNGGLGTLCQSYGWHLEYHDVYLVNSHRASKMYKTLSRLEKRFEAISARRSYPNSFGEYVGRVAEILGIDTFYFYSRHASDYDDCEFQILPVGDAIGKINEMSLEVQKLLLGRAGR